MPTIAVFIEQRAGDIKKVAWQMLSEARRLTDQHGGEVWAVYLDGAGQDVAAAAGQHGAHQVFTAQDAAFETYDSELWTTALASFLGSQKPDALLIASTALGKDLAPRLAARLKVACVSDAVGLTWNGGLTVRRPIFAGKCYAEVKAKTALAVVGIRPNAFAVQEFGGSATVASFAPQVAGVQPKARVTAVEAGGAAKVTLTEAADHRLGRPGASRERRTSPSIEALAEAMGAAVGASAGGRGRGLGGPPACRSARPGKTVSPTLYVACGISGAIQHLAGHVVLEQVHRGDQQGRGRADLQGGRLRDRSATCSRSCRS
jgi:electron transfer flavoprotein alpha subunit